MSEELQPVEIQHSRDHVFVKHGKARTKREKCVVCNKVVSHIAHHGYPPSLNLGGAGWNGFVYDSYKKAWQKVIVELLGQSGLPRPLKAVTVEGMICFPDRKGRDQGNFKFLLEKACGDALQEGGWLADDEFYPEVHYEFGGLGATYEKGESWTRLVLFPTPISSDTLTLSGGDSLFSVPET